jgi:hypothetical protein
MLMSGSGRAAKVRYLDGTFRLLSDGDHVLCAVSGVAIRSTSCAIGRSRARKPMPTPRQPRGGTARGDEVRARSPASLGLG